MYYNYTWWLTNQSLTVWISQPNYISLRALMRYLYQDIIPNNPNYSILVRYQNIDIFKWNYRIK